MWRQQQKRTSKGNGRTPQSGQGIVEYVIILMIVGIAVVAIIQVLEPMIRETFSRMVEQAALAPPALAGYTPPATAVPTNTIDPNFTPSATPTPTDTPIPTDTPLVSSTPTNTFTPTPTDTPTLTPTPPFGSCEFLEVGGLVVIEAEKAASQQAGTGIGAGNIWVVTGSYPGYTDTGAMIALANTNDNMGLTTNGPVLNYAVRIDTSGNYYMFVRGRPEVGSSDDTVHLGFNGAGYTLSGTGLSGFDSNPTNFHWQMWNAPVPLVAGQYTFNVWMREDGMIVDRIMLSTDPNVVAAGSTVTGPLESSAPAGCVALQPPTPTPTATPTDTSTPTATPTASNTPLPTNTPTNTPIPPTPTNTPTPAAGPVIYVSLNQGGSAGGLNYADEDIVRYDTGAGSWSMFWDGSDVPLGNGFDVDAFTILNDGSILISFTNGENVPGVGNVDDSDIVRFIPTSTGSTTAGTYQMYFDGSDVGLTQNGEDIDAIHVLSDGRILISTTGNVSVSGVNNRKDEDLLAFTPTQLGSSTSGSWAIYFDGSDEGLRREDVGGAFFDESTNKLYLSVKSGFSAGPGGDEMDVFACTLTSTGSSTTCNYDSGLYWDGSVAGLSGVVIDGLYIVNP